MRIARQVLSVGKLAALASLIGLTVLPFVSCSAGPMKVEFQGHELLRNTAPTYDGGTADGGRGGLKSVFDAEDRWLHIVYLTAVAAALSGIVVGARYGLVSAVVGLLATTVFLFGFRAKLRSEFDIGKNVSKDAPSMRLEFGAYLTLAGFLVGAVDGRARSRRKGKE